MSPSFCPLVWLRHLSNHSSIPFQFSKAYHPQPRYGDTDIDPLECKFHRRTAFLRLTLRLSIHSTRLRGSRHIPYHRVCLVQIGLHGMEEACCLSRANVHHGNFTSLHLVYSEPVTRWLFTLKAARSYRKLSSMRSHPEVFLPSGAICGQRFSMPGASGMWKPPLDLPLQAL